MPEKRDIFISYSRANTDFARDLYAKLQALGFTLWRDRNDMEGGDDWWRQIQEAIENVDTMILVLSPKALESRVVSEEWHYARQKGTRVIPVLAEPINFETAPRWVKKADVMDFRFAKSFRRRGWLGLAGYDPEHTLRWEKLIAQLKTKYEPRRVPFNAPKLEGFIERPKEFKALLDCLLDTERKNPVAITTALAGGAGFGKTTLAQALAHSVEVQNAFSDGIVWLTVGETPNGMLLISEALEVLTGAPSGFSALSAAQERLRELTKGRDILFILDDIWDDEVPRDLMDGLSESCACLLTTRRPDVAVRLKAQAPIAVNEMTNAEATQLLIRGLKPQPSDLPTVSALAAKLGEWPLLLSLAHAYLRELIHVEGLPLPDALSKLEDQLARQGFTAFDRARRENAQQRNQAIAQSMAVSLEWLDKLGAEAGLSGLSARFRELGIFYEDARIPFETAARLWRATSNMSLEQTETALSLMQRLSLFVRYDAKARAFRLHDVVRHYLIDAHRAALTELHSKFLRAYGVAHWAELPRDEPYLWDYLAYHLLEAHKRAELRAALLDYRYLGAKLDARDANALLSDFDAFLKDGDDKPARLVRQAVEMSAHVLTEDKAALAHQLYGRLYAHKELAEIAALRAQSAPRTLLPLDEPTHLQAGGHLLRTLRGHEGSVSGARELRDGRLLSWSDDGTLRLWAADGTEIAVLRGHRDKVLGARELRDGRLLSWSADKTLRLWAADGTEIAVLRGHEGSVSGALELRDGRLLSWSDDGTLRLWAADGTEEAVLRGHEGWVRGALELRDGRLLSWSWDKTLRLWAADGTEIAVLRGHESLVNGALELRDGRLLSWSLDKTLRLWAADGTERAVLRGHEGWVYGALELRDGRLLSWAEDKTLRLWAADGTERAVLRGHEGAVWGALELRDGRLLSWSLDRTLRLWAADGTERAVLRGHRNKVSGALELRDGRLLSWSWDRTLRLWAADGTERAVLRGHEGVVSGARELRDGRLLSWSGDLRLWAADGTEIAVLRGHRGEVRGALELRDGRLLSWAGYPDKTLRLWAADGTERAVLRGHEGSIKGALELRDGRLLSWAWDKTLRLWAADGTGLKVLRGHEDVVSGARELRDGRLLSWPGYPDTTLCLWAADGTELKVLRGHWGEVRGALELRDGRLLSWSGGFFGDKTLRLWAADGTPCAVLRGHRDKVWGALELRDGRLLSWAGYPDKTLRLWAADGTERAVLRGHEGSIKGALELRDGRLLSWSDDGTLRLWAADGTPLGAIRIDASPSEVWAWFAAHTDDETAYKQFMHARYGNSLAPSGSHRIAARNNVLHLYSAETGEELDRFYADSNISVARFTRDDVIALGCENGQVIFLKVNL